MEKATLSVKINGETYKKLKDHKRETGVSITFTIDKAVNEYFKQLERKDK